MMFQGIVNEPATVTVQGFPAIVGSDNTFKTAAPTALGTSTVTVKATDASGNIATKQYEVDSVGTGRTFTYDPNGNLTSDGTRTFEWDAADRIVAIVSGTTRSEFTYGGDDRRRTITEIENGILQSTSQWLWCDGTLCEERSADGATVVRRFLQRGVQHAGIAAFLTHDHLGSIREAVADTTLSGRYAYDPFGNASVSVGSASTERGYTGHYFHSPSGLYLTANRTLDSGVARWITPDPLGFADGPNLYAYVGGNPVSRVDPLGLEWIARICCNGKGGFKICWNPNAPNFDRDVMDCMEKHEQQHITDLTSYPRCKDLCKDKKKDFVIRVDKDTSDNIECRAYKTELDCLKKKGPLPKIRDRVGQVEGSIRTHCKAKPS
jgi:RHS repeat-associated protein